MYSEAIPNIKNVKISDILNLKMSIKTEKYLSVPHLKNDAPWCKKLIKNLQKKSKK